MAYSDFDLNYLNYSSTIANALDGGDAITNASLSNPLTTAGDYCRRFTTVLNNDSNATHNLKFSAKSSVLDGTLVSPAADTAISLRIWARLNTATFAGLAQLSVGVNAFSRADYYLGGWELMLRASQPTSGALSVDLILRGGPGRLSGNDSALANLNYNLLATCQSGLSLDTWYNIRMDIIPNSASQKTINCYIHDGTDWNLLTSLVRTTSDPDWPANLGTFYNRCGFSTFFDITRSTGANYNVSAYVDDFQASTETVE